MSEVDKLLDNEREWRRFIMERVQRTEDKVDEILTFKWTIIGGATLFSAILAIMIQIAGIYWSR